MVPFDPARFLRRPFGGHGGRLGLEYRAHGEDWVELALPFRADLVGDPEHGTVASGPIVSLMDVAASIAVWARRGVFVPHATLDLRVDHLRRPAAGRTLVGRGQCYRVTPVLAFVRGETHDGDPADPVAHVVGTYMTT